MKSIVSEVLARHEEEMKRASASGTTSQPLASPDDEELAKLVETLRVNIKIIGCGGGGSNTINRLTQSGIVGAELIATNSDAKHLLTVHAPKKILLGRKCTKGLGAGALPEIGLQAAKECEEQLKAIIDGSHIVFVTAGMGGGTGTGTAPYVAEMAKEAGALVMGIVTMPFKAEGSVRMQNAQKGLDMLGRYCDTTIVIQNDKLLELVPRLPLDAAFKVADEILMESIKGITEIITKPGLVNLDYNDMRTVMEGGGVAMVGIGESDAERDRIDEAINEALSSPLLGNIDLGDAHGALIRVVGGQDMTVSEAERAAELVGSKINLNARIIWGCSVDPTIEHSIQVLLVITGVRSEAFRDSVPKDAGPIDMVR